MALFEPVRRLRSIETRRSRLPPRDRADPNWEASWRYLFETYAPAMRRYVRGVLGSLLGHPATEDDAADVVQQYLATCVEKRWLETDAGSIRCFRAYLSTQLRRFTFDWVDHRLAHKRAPRDARVVALVQDVPSRGPDPAEQELDRGWVEVALDRALATIRAGNEDYYEILVDLRRTDGRGSSDIAARLRRPPAQLPNLRNRARARLSALFVEELRATVRDAEDLHALLDRVGDFLP